MKQPSFFTFTTLLLLLLLLVLFTPAVSGTGTAAEDADDETSSNNLLSSWNLRGYDDNNFINHKLTTMAMKEQDGGINPPFFPPLLPDNINGFQEEQKLNFVSSTLGSNMVLQRDRQAILWGFSSHPGSTITTKIVYSDNNQKDLILTTTSSLSSSGGESSSSPSESSSSESSDDVNAIPVGYWRQILPPHKGSLTPIDIIITSMGGESSKLTNVLFGDVYICGGQSNMQYSIGVTTNATKESQIANQYPHIRLFTVGQGTRSDDHPLFDLQTIEQNWTAANEHSISDGTQGGYFSSVCWFFGREISNGLQNQIPIGLISNNWGGTPIEFWQPGGTLYNAMIYPYIFGPMAITGFTWYQGEANTNDQNSANKYAMNFPKMITSWRESFQSKNAYFGFIQLSTWCTPNNIESIPQMRQAQMAAVTQLSNVGYATNADHGLGCNIHPPSKQYCGIRLGRSALALQYKHDIKWKSPSYLSSASSTSSSSMIAAVRRERNSRGDKALLVKAVEVSTIITLKDVSSDKGLYLLDDPYNTMNGTFDCSKQPQGTCAWASLLINNGKGWINGTISLIPDKPNQISINATISLVVEENQEQDLQEVVVDGNNNNVSPSTNAAAATKQNHDDFSVLATSYGWGGVPMMTLYDIETDLPVLPWKEKV